VCAQTSVVQSWLPHDNSAPAKARQVVKDACCQLHQADRLDDAQLLVSEVVTNAVRYGGPPIELTCTCDGDDGMVVRVSDTSDTQPTQPGGGELSENGRGLAIVAAFADDWGVDSTATGKQVWFLLCPTASGASPTALVPAQR